MSDPRADTREQSEPEADGFIGHAKESLSATRRLLGDVSELVALEVRLATTTGIRMLVGGLLLVLLVSGAWILGQLTLGVWLVALGWPLVAIVGLLALLNAVVAALVVWYIRVLSKRLTFPATRRLLFERSKEDANPQSHHPRAAKADHEGSRAA